MIKLKRKLKTKIMSGLLACSVLVPMLINPTNASAHNAFFIQSLINENNFTYSASIVEDRASLMNDESKHYEATLGDFSALGSANSANKLSDLASGLKDGKIKVEPGKGSEVMPLTYPPIQHKSKDEGNKKVNDATAKDSDRAAITKDILIPSLNEALILVNGGKNFKSVDELIDMTNKLWSISGTGKIGDYTITYGTKASSIKNDSYTYLGVNATDHVVITGKDGIQHDFIWRVPKGYKKITNREGDTAYPLNNGYSEYENDTEFITWGNLAYEAIYCYYGQNVTSNNSTEVTKPGSITKKLVDFLSDMVSSIKNALSLYSMDELVFNMGSRGNSATFFNGIMPTSWQDNVNLYFWIFQALAGCIMAFNIIKIIFDKNLSTINAAKRFEMIDAIQRLIVGGFALTMIFPLIHLVTKTNVNLVNIFSAASGQTFSQMVGNMADNGDTVGSILLALANLGIMVYMNYLYIIRAFTIALLIASAPLFIALSIANRSTGNQIIGAWTKEFLSNIFIQTFHAFIISFFTTLSVQIRGIEGVTLFIALIPLTAMFKAMIFKDGGNTSSRVAALGTALTAGAAATGIKSINKIGSSSSRSNRNSKENSDSRETNTATTTNSKLKGTDSKGNVTNEKFDSTTNNSAISSGDGGTLSNTLSASNGSAGEGKFMGVINKGTEKINKLKDSGMQKINDTDFKKVGKNVGVAALKGSGSIATSALKNGSKIALGAAAVGIGLGAASEGGVGMVTSGLSMAGSGVSGAVKDTTNGVKGLGKSAKNGYGSFKDGSFNKSGIDDDSIPVDDTKLTKSETEMLDSENVSENLPNGEMQIVGKKATISRTMSDLKSHGVDWINCQNGNPTVTYGAKVEKMDDGRFRLDTSSVKGKLNSRDSQNLVDCVNTFNSPSSTEADKQYYREQGIENATVGDNGKIKITYNQKGKESLGYEKIGTVGKGDDRRVIETKANGANIVTKKTLTIPPMSQETRERLTPKEPQTQEIPQNPSSEGSEKN